MSEYNKLNEKYMETKSKSDVIQGLLMAQAMASRSLLEDNSPAILKLMGNISTAIENIKDEK